MGRGSRRATTDVVVRESAAERLNLFPPPKLVERLEVSTPPVDEC
jgi:hypothetical protein